MHVNAELLKFKLLYFFELSVVSTLIIYLPQFMIERGVTAMELAFISLLENIVSFMTRPLFGYLVDIYHKYKEIMIVTTVGSWIMFMLHLVAPTHTNPASGFALSDHIKLTQLGSDNSSLISLCSRSQVVASCWPDYLVNCSQPPHPGHLFQSAKRLMTDHNCSVYFASAVRNLSLYSAPIVCSTITAPSCNDSSAVAVPVFPRPNGLTLSSTFWTLGLLKVLGFAMYAPLISLTDSILFVTLGKDQAQKYGFTRMFGTFGVLLFSGISALIFFLANRSTVPAIVALQTFSQFSFGFLLATVVFLCLLITTFYLRNEQNIRSNSIIKALSMVFNDLEVFIFFVFTVLGGFVMQIIIQYYFIIVFIMFPNPPKFLPGFLLAVMTLSESIFFGISGKLLKLMRYEFWVSFSFFVWAVRWFCYVKVKSYWLLLLIEILQGPSFGIMLPCLTTHISTFASPNSMGRVQGLFSAMYFNIGGALGGLFGGLVLDRFGYKSLYWSLMGLSLLCGLVYCPLQWLITRRKTSGQKVQNANSQSDGATNGADFCLTVNANGDLGNEEETRRELLS